MEEAPGRSETALIPKAEVRSGWRVCGFADLELRGPPATREQERLWMRAGGL